MIIPLLGGAYQLDSVNVEAQRLVNMYTQLDESREGKTPGALRGTPGLSLYGTYSETGGVRCLRTLSDGTMLAVIGSGAYRVTVSSATKVGTLATVGGLVDARDNGTTCCIVDGPNGYFLTLADNTFAQITDEAFHGATNVAIIDGYFLFNSPGTGEFYLATGTTFDALDFATAEGAPDPVIGLIEQKRELVLFGADSIEIWYDSGNPDFPFERIQGAFIEHGCAAAFSVAKLDDALFWLGTDIRGGGIVWRNNGYQPQRISTFAIEQILAMGDVSDAVAFSYRDKGHPYYVLNLPTINRTLVFDVGSGLWHERGWLNPVDGSLNRHRAQCHAYFNGQHIVGDWENPKLYVLTDDARDDNGDPILRLRTFPHLFTEKHRQYFHEIELDVEAGFALGAEEPIARLSWSNDGGHTYGNELEASFGKIGEYKARMRWRRLGQGRDRVYKVAITDNVKCSIVGAYGRNEAGQH